MCPVASRMSDPRYPQTTRFLERMTMNTRIFLIGVLLVALASPGWSQAAAGEAERQTSADGTWINAKETNVAYAMASDEKPNAASPDTSSNGPNTECCEALSCCNMCPCVYGEIEGLFLRRCAGHPDRTLLIDANTRATLVSSSDFDFDFNPGVRALFGFRLWGCRSVEFGYFGLFDTHASIDFVPANRGVDVTLPGALGIASNVFHGDVRVHMEYLSRIQGAEVNFPCCCSSCCCSSGCSDCGPSCSAGCSDCGPATSIEWFAGFRYLSVREDLRISGVRTVNTLDETAFYDTNSRNDLFGAQLGARIRRCRGQFSWEATGKAGIFGNSVGQEQLFVDYPGFLLRPTTGANGGNVAFMGELNLTGIYQINKTWGLRLGYNLMLIEGLALAPDQTDFTFTSTSGTAINTRGGMFLHGINVGVEARW